MTLNTAGLRVLIPGMALSLAVILSACGGDGDTTSGANADAGATGSSGAATAGVLSGGGTAPPPPTQTETALPTETATPAGGAPVPPPPGFGSDAPPATTATANGATAEMGIGTYCWTSMCVDKIGVPTRGTLVVSNGDVVTVAVPASTPPLREAFAQAFEAQDGAGMPIDDGIIWPYGGQAEETLGYVVSGQAIEVEIDLEPGTYVLALGMFFERGDVIYGVLLEVQ